MSLELATCLSARSERPPTILAGSSGGSNGDPGLPPGVRTLLEFIAWVVFSHQQKLLSRQVHQLAHLAS